MIVSVSRRTDIPCLYWPWFLNRLRAGYCLVRNPINPSNAYKVSLAPEDVEAIVFWSKNPAAMLKTIRELDLLNPRYYLLFTLNDYPKDLEPCMPSVEERARTFLELSDRIGPDRVIWRYDPVILSNHTDADYHRKRFAALCSILVGHTKRVIISVLDMYRRTRSRLSVLSKKGWQFPDDPLTEPSLVGLLADLASMARANGMSMQSCAEGEATAAAGIPSGSCVDPVLIGKFWGSEVSKKKDPTQRPSCLCAISRDIGTYGTCTNGCLYCYAGGGAAQRMLRPHDPFAESLI